MPDVPRPKNLPEGHAYFYAALIMPDGTRYDYGDGIAPDKLPGLSRPPTPLLGPTPQPEHIALLEAHCEKAALAREAWMKWLKTCAHAMGRAVADAGY